MLHAALRAFAEEAAGLLAGETAQGAEIPFELAEAASSARRARTPLYCYRPLVGEFLRTRASALLPHTQPRAPITTPSRRSPDGPVAGPHLGGSGKGAVGSGGDVGGVGVRRKDHVDLGDRSRW